MRYFRNGESGQMTHLGLGLVLLILGIIAIFFVYSPLGSQIFGVSGQLSKKYAIIGAVMIVVGLVLAQRGIKKM
jgi:hypothetical protein